MRVCGSVGDLKVTSLEECPRWEFQELNEVEEREETAVWRPASDDFQALAFIRQPDDVVHMAFDNRPPELSSKIVMQCLEVSKSTTITMVCVRLTSSQTTWQMFPDVQNQ